MKKWILAIMLLALSSHVLAAKVRKTVGSLDRATRIEVNGYYGLDCGSSMICCALGAKWLSNQADDSALRVEAVNVLSGISEVKLRIDDEFFDLQPFQQLTNFESGQSVKTSRRDFHIPTDLLRRMVAATNVKVRIVTHDGLIDARFSGGKKPSKAYDAFKEFVEAIPAP